MSPAPVWIECVGNDKYADISSLVVVRIENVYGWLCE